MQLSGCSHAHNLKEVENMHLSIFSIFPPKGGGGGGGCGRDTLGIRQQIWEGKLDTFSRSSKLKYLTNLMAHQN